MRWGEWDLGPGEDEPAVSVRYSLPSLSGRQYKTLETTWHSLVSQASQARQQHSLSAPKGDVSSPDVVAIEVRCLISSLATTPRVPHQNQQNVTTLSWTLRPLL